MRHLAFLGLVSLSVACSDTSANRALGLVADATPEALDPGLEPTPEVAEPMADGVEAFAEGGDAPPEAIVAAEAALDGLEQPGETGAAEQVIVPPADEEFEVSTRDNGYWPSVATLSEGRFVTIWSGQVGAGGLSAILGRLSTSTDPTAGQPFTVEVTGGSTNPPGVFVLPGGGFGVAWVGFGDGLDMVCKVRLYSDAAAPVSTDLALPIAPGSSCLRTAASAWPDGRWVAAWTDLPNDGSGARILRTQAFEADGAPVEAPHDVASEDFYLDLSVVALPTGEAVVAWTAYEANGAYRPMALWLDQAGGKVGEPFPLGSSHGQETSLVLLAGGRVLATWATECSIEATVLASPGDTTGQELTAATLVGTDCPSNTHSAAALGEGGFVVAWDLHDATRVAAQRFDASGAAVGSPVAVPLDETGMSFFPAVAGWSDDDSYAAVWVHAGNYAPAQSYCCDWTEIRGRILGMQ